MASLANLKRRIRSVNNTLKTTSAMQMISSVKMRRAVEATTKSRSFVLAAEAVLARVASVRAEVSHPLTDTRHVHTILLVVVTSDKGLAGSYNSDVIRRSAALVAESRSAGQAVSIITIGRKAREFFARFTDITLVASFDQLGDSVTFRDVAPIAQTVIDGYSAAEYDQVRVIYKKFVSTLHQEVDVPVVLPATTPSADEVTAAGPIYTFEPDAEAVLTAVLPYLTRMRLYQAMLEARASEHAARMVAMKSATDAGSDLVNDLVFTANAIRQEKITAEIAEIAAGAAALKQ